MPFDVRENVASLIRLAEQGKFLEAIEAFYAENASMQENNQPPRAGLANLLEQERATLARVQDMRVSHAEAVVDGNNAVIHWVFEYTGPDGKKYRLEELASQLWRDAKIVRERFYYDPAQRSTEIQAQENVAAAHNR